MARFPRRKESRKPKWRRKTHYTSSELAGAEAWLSFELRGELKNQDRSPGTKDETTVLVQHSLAAGLEIAFFCLNWKNIGQRSLPVTVAVSQMTWKSMAQNIFCVTCTSDGSGVQTGCRSGSGGGLYLKMSGTQMGALKPEGHSQLGD